MPPDPALVHLPVARELALEFLAVFSRLEFALKVTNFRQPGEGEAKANWIGFANEIAGAFNPGRTPKIANAFAYLTGQPLRRLAVENGALDWYPFTVPQGISDAERVVRVVRQIRNNLFHGGKFARDPHANAERDTRLLEASLVVLRELRRLAPQVEEAYVR